MDPKAVVKATERLEHARAALMTMQNARKAVDMEKAWIEFLVAANGIYAKLEQGAKTNGASKGWFGRKKHERKKDELLSYIHHARHAEEHTIDGSTYRQKLEAAIADGEGYSVFRPKPGDGNPTRVVRKDPKTPINLKVTLPGLRMHPTRDDRYGDVFYPPTKHLGQDFKDVRPVGVAQAAVTYLERLVAEAADLAR